MKKFKFVLILCLFASYNYALAQGPNPGLPGDSDGGSGVTDNPAAPITSLIPLALIIGAGLGVYKINNKK